MKSFILSIAMSLFPLFVCAQSYDKLWKQVQEHEEDGKPKSAYDVAEKILKKARRSKDQGQALSARLKMAALHQEWAPDSFFMDIRELESMRATAKRPEVKAVYASLLAELYEMNRDRSQAYHLELTSQNIEEWTREQYDSAAVENWRLSMQDLPALSAAKSKDWLPFIEQQEQSAYFKHDLLHVLWNRAKGQTEDIWIGTKRTKESLAKAVAEEYKRLGNREATLLIMLEWIDLQDDEDDVELLEALKHEYADLPLCAEVYLRLMEETNDSKERVMLAHECISRYPKYERIGKVQNKLNETIAPLIYWEGKSHYYPGKTYNWIISSRNAKSLTIEILRMPKDFRKNALSGELNKRIAEIRKEGTPVSSFTQELEVVNPWESRKDTIPWEALEPGNYMIIFTGETVEPEAKVVKNMGYTGFICTRIQPLRQDGLGKQRMVIVDSETGHPIQGATVDFYRIEKTARVPIATLTTDAEGRVALDNDVVKEKNDFRLYRKVSVGDDIYLDAEESYFSKDGETTEYSISSIMRLYTDRSIYRPGQMVHVGGILYHQQHWDAGVEAGRRVELVLRDANDQEVSTQQATTDEMGKISTDFALPQGGLPGRYRLEVQYENVEGEWQRTNHYIDVEEYKRPTFEVTMNQAPDMQWPAEDITLTGKAIGYNGVPVREARVTGTYQFRYPYWWFRRYKDSERMPIDTIKTDENGCFSIRVPLKSLTEEALWGGLNLQLEVDVLSIAGETRQGSKTVLLCKKPLRLYVSVPQQEDRDRLTPISIDLISSTGQSTEGTVEWSIFPVNEKERTSEVPVMNGTLQSKDKKVTFDINTLRTLASGQYEFYAKGISGENCDSTKAYFLIFSMNDTKLPQVTKNWLYCPEETFNAAKPARVQVGSSLEDLSFYYSIVSNKKVVKECLIPLSDELKVIEIPYTKDMGDGATFHYAFVKEGIVYKGEQTLRLTQPDQNLQWEWKTFRDRLHPGDTETWTLSLRTPDGKPASAQVMATLYDASLDALRSHYWSLFVNRAYNISSLPWSNINYYSYFSSERFNFSMKSYEYEDMDYDEFNAECYEGLSFKHYWNRGVMVYEEAAMPMAMPMLARADETRVAKRMVKAAAKGIDNDAAESEEQVEEVPSDEGGDTVGEAQASVRQKFNETAAFLPRLQTNAKGEVNLTFTLPESLTTWRMLGIAHTKDMMSTTFSGKTIASKDMMARLYLPRFLRMDDHASIRATVQNMTEANIDGTALLEIFDPETERIIVSERKTFSAQANGECLLTFDYTPDDKCSVVAVRLTADSKTFSDGEQHYLPILPNKTYVTESVEIRADSLGTFNTDLTSLFNHDSPTATNRRLTVEYTTHPIWHALQALPSLIEPQYDDIISLCTSLQAQALSTYIANKTPRLKTLVEIWQREQAQGQPSLASKLAEDEELKQIILDETPWLREAENEADRKQRLIQLFNISQQENVLTSIAQRMEQRLDSEGGYSWFPGMPCSEYMTRTIATELARLKVMTNDFQTLPADVKRIVNHLLEENVEFIAKKTAKYVKEMKEDEKQGKTIHTASMMYLEYVYTTQHAGVKLTSDQKADVKYLLDHMKGSVADMDNWERAIAAVVMKGDNRQAEARQYYESLLEHTTTTADKGTYFDYVGGSFNPTSHKIIHHVAAMEAVQVMEPNNKTLQKGLRRWLLQQKRTQMWESNICTVDAIYALLTGNTAELNASEPDNIKLNYTNRQVDINRQDADQAVAGLGFIKKQFADGEAPQSITVERRTDSEAWGAVFATYLTPMTDATASHTGLNVRREISTTTPEVGERLTCRYVISADRDYEYVCLRVARAASMEPADQISGYHYQGGLGFYRAVRDAHTDYFFDHLPKGTYMIEETSFVDRSGIYTTGLTTIRCLYAPEYGANTPAVELTVE